MTGVANKTSVVCPGVVFSSLLSDQINYTEVQEGFLLGSTVQHTSTHISDDDINKQTLTTTTHISSYDCLDLLGCLYDSAWKIRDSTVDTAVRRARENNQEVVGWYVKRCYVNSWSKVHMRERFIHLQLQEKLSAPNLLLVIFNWKQDGPDTSVYYSLNVHKENKFHRLPLKVSNLGNTSSSDYNLSPPNPSLYKSATINLLEGTVRAVEAAVDEVNTLHECLEQTVGRQLEQLSEAEQKYSAALKQLCSLRAACYQNGIVPEFELPSELEQEKEQTAGILENDTMEKRLPEEEENTKEVKTNGIKTDLKTGINRSPLANRKTLSANPRLKNGAKRLQSPSSRPKSATPDQETSADANHNSKDIKGIDSGVTKLSMRDARSPSRPSGPRKKSSPSPHSNGSRPSSASRKSSTPSTSQSGRCTSSASPSGRPPPHSSVKSMSRSPSAKRKLETSNSKVSVRSVSPAAEGEKSKQAWK